VTNGFGLGIPVPQPLSLTPIPSKAFFSLLKRGINGTIHHVGKGDLAKYVDEFAFRYNTRKEPDAVRPLLIVQAAEGERLTYKQPV
jgi:hypothetical protein